MRIWSADSDIGSRPLVREMAEHLALAGLCTAAAVMGAYDRRTEEAAVTSTSAAPDDSCTPA